MRKPKKEPQVDCSAQPHHSRADVAQQQTLNFGDTDRFWEFRSLGRGSIDFEEIIRALNEIGYNGPLSIEWEDGGMDREHGAEEACAFTNAVDFPSSDVAFDAAFSDE